MMLWYKEQCPCVQDGTRACALAPAGSQQGREGACAGNLIQFMEILLFFSVIYKFHIVHHHIHTMQGRRKEPKGFGTWLLVCSFSKGYIVGPRCGFSACGAPQGRSSKTFPESGFQHHSEVSDQIGHITRICLLWNLTDFIFMVSVFTRNAPKSRLSTRHLSSL